MAPAWLGRLLALALATPTTDVLKKKLTRKQWLFYVLWLGAPIVDATDDVAFFLFHVWVFFGRTTS